MLSVLRMYFAEGGDLISVAVGFIKSRTEIPYSLCPFNDIVAVVFPGDHKHFKNGRHFYHLVDLPIKLCHALICYTPLLSKSLSPLQETLS